MNNSTAKQAIENFVKLDNELKFKYIDGNNEQPDEFTIKCTTETYAPGYTCTININLDFNSGFWVVDVNGFNKLTDIDNDVELVFALRQLMKYRRVLCPEQELHNLNEAKNKDKSDDFYY